MTNFWVKNTGTIILSVMAKKNLFTCSKIILFIILWYLWGKNGREKKLSPSSFFAVVGSEIRYPGWIKSGSVIRKIVCVWLCICWWKYGLGWDFSMCGSRTGFLHVFIAVHVNHPQLKIGRTTNTLSYSMLLFDSQWLKLNCRAVLWIRPFSFLGSWTGFLRHFPVKIADLIKPLVADPGSGAFLTPGSGFEIRIRNLEYAPKSYLQELSNSFRVKYTLIFCCGSGIRCVFDAASGIQYGKIHISTIEDPQHLPTVFLKFCLCSRIWSVTGIGKNLFCVNSCEISSQCNIVHLDLQGLYYWARSGSGTLFILMDPCCGTGTGTVTCQKVGTGAVNYGSVTLVTKVLTNTEYPI